jgi:hypothetical protein
MCWFVTALRVDIAALDYTLPKRSRYLICTNQGEKIGMPTGGATSRVPHLCYYTVSIRPTSLQTNAPEYTKWWTKGTYAFKLNYESGKATASKVFSFTIP